MARNFTVAQLLLAAQESADMENDDILSAAEWQRNLNSVYGQMHGILCETGMRYFESEETITTDGGAQYVLPSDYLSSIGVDYEYTSGGARVQLSEMMAQERNIYTGQAASSGQARGWATIGQNLTLYPAPPSGQTYYHVYVPQAADLSTADTGDLVDVVTPDGEQFLRWGMVVMAKAKEESDVRLAMNERQMAEGRLREWATLRALNNPRRPVVIPHGGHNFDAGDWGPRGGGGGFW